eukprot:gene10412-10570_t
MIVNDADTARQAVHVLRQLAEYGLQVPTKSSGTLQHVAPAPTTEDILQDPTAREVIEVFREFFEEPKFQKIWHNYGFDRHVLQGLGFKVSGFGGDTLHMARLHDASRKLAGGYSLESLSGDKEAAETGSGSSVFLLDI